MRKSTNLPTEPETNLHKKSDLLPHRVIVYLKWNRNDGSYAPCPYHNRIFFIDFSV